LCRECDQPTSTEGITPHLKTEDVVMSCLIRAYAHLGLVIGKYGWWISRRKLKKLPKIPVSVPLSTTNLT
jgi:hypothetical protein